MSIFIDDVSEPGSWERAIRQGGLDCREHCPSDREADQPRCEVKSVPVHADGMTETGARNHVR